MVHMQKDGTTLLVGARLREKQQNNFFLLEFCDFPCFPDVGNAADYHMLLMLFLERASIR